MPSSGNSDDLNDSKSPFPLSGDGAPSSVAMCVEQVWMIDQLCRRAADLNAVAASVRSAIERDEVDGLEALRRDFEAIRGDIVRRICELSLHRTEHGCGI